MVLFAPSRPHGRAKMGALSCEQNSMFPGKERKCCVAGNQLRACAQIEVWNDISDDASGMFELHPAETIDDRAARYVIRIK